MKIPIKENMSLENQIKAMYGWAIKVQNRFPKLNWNIRFVGKKEKMFGTSIKTMLKLLRYIDVQGRRVQWRKTGLRSLPKTVAKRNLKNKINEARAAVKVAEKRLRKASIKRIAVMSVKPGDFRSKDKLKSSLVDFKQNLSILIKVLKDATVIMEQINKTKTPGQEMLKGIGALFKRKA